MSRVLFVSTSTTLGGAEKTLYTLATLLNPKEFQVAGVISLKPLGVYAERLKAQGVPAYTLGMTSRPTLATWRRLGEIIERTRPDLVHALMYQAIQLCRLAKKRGRVPFKLVSSPRVSYRTRASWTLWLDRLLKGADDLLVAESLSTRDHLVKGLGYSADKVKVIHNGVDLAGWPASKLDRSRKRLELRLEAGDLLIGAVGRLDAQKAQGVLVDAVSRLKDRLPLRCVILGDGPRRAALQAQIRRLSLERHVWLLGEREDVPAWLSSLDLFVLPSLWEGLPNALLEAMALGVPAVASAVDGVREVIEDGVNGALVPPGSPQALARKIEVLLGDPQDRARLGAAARATITRKFGLLSMISAYEDAYREVLSRR